MEKWLRANTGSQEDRAGINGHLLITYVVSYLYVEFGG